VFSTLTARLPKGCFFGSFFVYGSLNSSCKNFSISIVKKNTKRDISSTLSEIKEKEAPEKTHKQSHIILLLIFY